MVRSLRCWRSPVRSPRWAVPLQVRLAMPCPTVYKGLSFTDKKNRKRQEGVTPHAVTYFPETDHCFVVTSRRMPYNAHLKPPEEIAEDPHAACAYRLADAAARKRAGELRWHLRAVAPHTLALVAEYKFKPLEHVLCAKTARCLQLVAMLSVTLQACIGPNLTSALGCAAARASSLFAQSVSGTAV